VLPVLPLLPGDRPGVTRVRARTISITRLSQRALRQGELQFPEQPGQHYQRPRTYADCERAGLGTEQPCPFVSCRRHLALDVNPRTGAIKLNFPDLEVDEMPETCALAVADRGGLTLDGVARAMNLTRERIRQLEVRALRTVRAQMARAGLACDDLAPEDRADGEAL